MTTPKNILELFADILSYPTERYHESVGAWDERLQSYGEQGAGFASPFREFTRDKSVHELEEYFTQTFDINPVSCLEVGWHLFGENYDRGSFLVHMREQLRTHGIPESSELPDHINHVLLVLSRLKAPDAQRFTHSQIIPALRKMLSGFDGKANAYENVLRALVLILEREYPEPAGTTHPADGTAVTDGAAFTRHE